MCAYRNSEADPGLKRHDFLARPLLAPHFATPSDDIPDLFDCAMHNGLGGLARGEVEVSHPTRREPEQDPDGGAIRRHGGWTRW
ncbi:MAG TPA: hypothetical protein VES89_00590 [Candidatus Competibacteraceae bacterium]|nr:hypothetical protein [Candidatus Competibacteraceae bacterium]